MVMATFALALQAAASPQPLQGEYSCMGVGNVVVATLRAQTGQREVAEMTHDEFRYANFRFDFIGDEVVVRLQVNGELREQKVPYFRRGNYVTFNFNQGLAETGWASPITFWTNEAAAPRPRYEASFPVASMRQMTTLSGATFVLGDAAMAVVALSCRRGEG